MAYKNIILEKKDKIAKITLNRPEVLNGLDSDTFWELLAALEDIEKDSDIRAVVIAGAGRAFCAGADLKSAKAMLQERERIYEWLRLGHKVFGAIENFPKPVIAMVHGFALAGGLELMLSCDLVIVADDARLADQHANYGLLAGWGGTQRLPRIIGIRKAKEQLLTGDWLTAAEAERLGLVNRIVPADKLEEATMELAGKLASKSPMAARAAKTLVNRGMQCDLSTALELELWTVITHFGSEDLAEGLNAFAEKREPVFPGK